MANRELSTAELVDKLEEMLACSPAGRRIIEGEGKSGFELLDYSDMFSVAWIIGSGDAETVEEAFKTDKEACEALDRRKDFRVIDGGTESRS